MKRTYGSCPHIAWVIALTLLARGFATAAVPEPLDGIVIAPPKPVAPFTLIDHNGEEFNQMSLQGFWTFLFFGYTHCPDICPTTLTELNRVANRLAPQPPQAGNVRFVFVSVDPDRDTIPVLNDYVRYFNTSFIGATSTLDELQHLTRQFGARFRHGKDYGAGYTVDHGSAVMLLDPQGRYFARFRAPHYTNRITEQFELIKTYYQDSQ